MDRESVLLMDPIILLSMVNMKLRDRYSSLEDLVEDLDLDKSNLEKRLNTAGYKYVKDQNQFK